MLHNLGSNAPVRAYQTASESPEAGAHSGHLYALQDKELGMLQYSQTLFHVLSMCSTVDCPQRHGFLACGRSSDGVRELRGRRIFQALIHPEPPRTQRGAVVLVPALFAGILVRDVA
jgi:hypothetical protein